MLVTAWICDKYRIRGPVMLFNSLVGIIGLCLMVCLKQALGISKE